MPVESISGFGIVLLFIIGGIAFLVITLLVGKLLRPNRPNEEKITTYESGEDPINAAWSIFNIRFYIIALVFLLFEAELVFLFPWAIIFADEKLIETTNGQWGIFSFIEIFIFIGILVLGLIYVWANGMLDWVKPKPGKSDFKSPVPPSEYEEFNRKFN